MSYFSSTYLLYCYHHFTNIEYIPNFLLSFSFFHSGLSNKTIYYSKVAAEVSKTVYAKEGLAPPTIAEFTKVYECAVKQAQLFAKDPKASAELIVKNAQGFSKDEILRYICYFIQIVGFFSLGEIIGRRNVVGYAEH